MIIKTITNNFFKGGVASTSLRPWFPSWSPPLCPIPCWGSPGPSPLWFLMITIRKIKWNNDILHLLFHDLLSLTNLSASTRRSCRWKGTSSHFSIAFLLLPWLFRFMFRFCNKNLHFKFYCFWMDIVFPPLLPNHQPTVTAIQPTNHLPELQPLRHQIFPIRPEISLLPWLSWCSHRFLPRTHAARFAPIWLELKHQNHVQPPSLDKTESPKTSWHAHCAFISFTT